MYNVFTVLVPFIPSDLPRPFSRAPAPFPAPWSFSWWSPRPFFRASTPVPAPRLPSCHGPPRAARGGRPASPRGPSSRRPTPLPVLPSPSWPASPLVFLPRRPAPGLLRAGMPWLPLCSSPSCCGLGRCCCRSWPGSRRTSGPRPCCPRLLPSCIPRGLS